MSIYTDALDNLIRDSLLDLTKFVARTNWRGREREAVSLYAFGFLVPRCRPDGPLSDPTQIGIDVAVRQLPGTGRKTLVCKDLVLWPTAAGTCWDENGQATRGPLAIIEWKARTKDLSNYDESWLLGFSAGRPDFLGYAVSLCPNGAQTTLAASQVRGRQLTRGWLRFPEG